MVTSLSEQNGAPVDSAVARSRASLASDSLCLVGFGNVGYHWVRTLLDAGYDREQLVVLYLPHDDERLARARQRANDLGVQFVTDPSAVPREVGLFVHATTAEHAAAILEWCVPALGPGSTWVDVNSTGPRVKSAMAEVVATTGAAFADGAIMAAAWKHGHRTPVWVAGPGAAAFATWAERWQTPVVVIDGEPGAAASIKMSRSLILKGFAASLVEGLAVAEVLGVREAVVASLSDDLGADVVDSFRDRFVRPTLQHARRRAAEVDQAVDMSQAAGWNAVVGSAVAAFLERIARVGGPSIAETHEDERAILAALGEAYIAADQELGPSWMQER